MKTFEVYSLYNTQYRGRTLVATVQADSYSTLDGIVYFFKNGFFSNTPIGTVNPGGAFAVLDTEFSLSIEKGVAEWKAVDVNSESFGAEIAPKKRSRSRRKENPLDLS